MTREEAIAELTIHLEHWKRLKEEHIAPKGESERTIEAIDMAISALEQKNTYADVINSTDNKVYSNIHNAEPFGYHSAEQTEPSDLISRADAVKAMRKLLGKLGEKAEIELNCLTGYVPSVSAERVGEWIEVDSNGCCRCSECGKFTATYHANYCPNCGAKMKGGAE